MKTLPSDWDEQRRRFGFAADAPPAVSVPRSVIRLTSQRRDPRGRHGSMPCGLQTARKFEFSSLQQPVPFEPSRSLAALLAALLDLIRQFIDDSARSFNT